MTKRILMIAGEASGDIYGASLVKHIRTQDPSLRVVGIGGDGMQKSGAELYAHARDLGVVGLAEILPRMGVILRAYRMTRALIAEKTVDLVVLIDYPGFNIKMAKAAHRSGIPVVYYISPQVWAWKAWRVPIMARCVSKMLVVFPFEEEIYRRAGLSCEFVGHPLMDDYREFLEGHPFSQEEQKKRFGLDPDRPVVGIFPGSRKSEITSMLNLFLDSARRIRSGNPEVQFLLAVAPTLKLREIGIPLSHVRDLDIRWVEHDPHGSLLASDAVLAASGTITLQAAIHEKPMVIAYRVWPLTWWIAKRLVRVGHIGLPNIIAGQTVVPELLQSDATPDRISEEILKFLEDPGYREETRAGLLEVKRKLGSPGASARAAKIILGML